MAEKIGDIKAELLKASTIDEYNLFCDRFGGDDRAGVKKLVESAKKHITAIENEKKRLYEMRTYERLHADKKYICGIYLQSFQLPLQALLLRRKCLLSGNPAI